MASVIPLEPSRRTPRNRIRIWMAYAAAAWLCGQAAAAALAQARPSEYDVKAAYLLNFGKFMHVAGPAPGNRASFDICILGRDPIGHAMDAIADDESIDSRPVRVERIANAGEGRGCDILFVSSYEGEEIRRDLAALNGADVLTVSDAPDFLDRGGMIQFVLEADHVRFEVNLDAVNRTHLVLSSELLRVAAAVKGNPAGGRR